MAEARVKRSAWRGVGLGAALAVAACSASPPLGFPAKPAPPTAPVSAAPNPASAPAASEPSPAALAPPPETARPAEKDTCGLAALGDLVGKPRSEIPVPVNPSGRRVVCEGCPVTMDYSPGRQTITYDPATGKVTKLACN